MSVAHLPLQSRPTIVSIAQRVQSLQAEARAMARDHIAEFERALDEAVALAAEINSGGDAYPVGARAIAHRLAPELADGSIEMRVGAPAQVARAVEDLLDAHLQDHVRMGGFL